MRWTSRCGRLKQRGLGSYSSDLPRLWSFTFNRALARAVRVWWQLDCSPDLAETSMWVAGEVLVYMFKLIPRPLCAIEKSITIQWNGAIDTQCFWHCPKLGIWKWQVLTFPHPTPMPISRDNTAEHNAGALMVNIQGFPNYILSKFHLESNPKNDSTDFGAASCTMIRLRLTVHQWQCFRSRYEYTRLWYRTI